MIVLWNFGGFKACEHVLELYDGKGDDGERKDDEVDFDLEG